MVDRKWMAGGYLILGCLVFYASPSGHVSLFVALDTFWDCEGSRGGWGGP